MDKDFYIGLIYKELKGELSDSESHTLEEFYKESDDNRTLRDEVQLSWMLSQEVSDLPNIDIDVEHDLKQVKNSLGHYDVKDINKTKVIPMWRRLASIAAIAIPLLIGGFFLFQYFSQPQIIAFSTSDEIKVFKLEDGSSVWLNKNSSIELANDFNDIERNLKLKGEAFFDIERNPDKPFKIQTGLIDVTVLGTSFNVKEKNNEITVNVVSGKVEVASPENSVELIKDEKAIFKKDIKSLQKNTLNNQNEIYWKTGTFIYKNESLASVVQQLELLFSKQIEIENTEVETCGIALVIQANNFENILNKVAGAVNCEIKKTGKDNYQLMGGECN